MLDNTCIYQYNTKENHYRRAYLMANNNVFYSRGIEYEKMTDEQLLKLIRKEDKTALNRLIDRYKEAVEIKVTKFYISGAEKDDIMQEGLIGLYKSIRDFNLNKQNSFKTFANLCIERQIITAIKGSNRQKHMPLNSYVSLNNTNYENDNGEVENQLIDVLNSNTVEDPLETITKNEYMKDVKNSINESLSDFEKKVLNKLVQGQSYNEIAKSLNSPVKSVDNAIQRIRKKTVKNIQNLT